MTAGRSLSPMTRLAAVILMFAASPAFAEDAFLGTDFSSLEGSVEIEGTFFAEDARFDGQEENGVSVAVRAKTVLEWEDTALGGADATVTITPFVRFDPQDGERTHADLREAKLDLRFERTDVTLGNDFVLGTESRLRGATIIDGGDARYESGAEEWTPSFAARLAGFYGDFDIGVSAFHGLSRDPAFEVRPGSFDPATGDFELRPVYGRITQVGLDGQYTAGATLWKTELIGRFDQRNLSFEKEDYVAAIAGLEHTLYGVAGSNADLGLIAEYAYDSRGDDALTIFENDTVFGARLAMNDTQDTSALLTATVDTETAETLLRLEGERRIGEIAKLSIESGAFINTDENSPADQLQDDHFVRLTLAVFW